MELMFDNLGFLGERVLVIHGIHSWESCGAKSVIMNMLHAKKTFEFTDFSSNPKKEDVDKGVLLLKDFKPDLIIAVGGGSVIDMGKLIRYYSDCKYIPLIAIPTTAGSGAEVTQFAVCYINEVKHSITDISIRPNKVILYPPFTYNNSAYLTACTGFDALAQAIESYWNINATLESDNYSIQAIKKIYPVLCKKDKTYNDRSDLLLGANLAGKAINITRTTIPHALSYTLTSKYGYPHGHAVALTFPFFLKYNIEGYENDYKGNNYHKYKRKMMNLCKLLEIDGTNPFNLMKDYIKRLGIGFDPNRDFKDDIVIKGINLERAKNTPIAINKSILIEAVKSIRI